MASVSNPSLATGVTSINTTLHASQGGSPSNLATLNKPGKNETYAGKRLLEGPYRRITLAVLQLPWVFAWQVIIFTSVFYNFFVLLVVTYVIDDATLAVDLTLMLAELIFLCDFIINMLHYYWAAVRLYIRVNRRGLPALIYDGISVVPFYIIRWVPRKYDYYGIPELLLFSRWMRIGRVYRMMSFFYELNRTMRTGRFWIFLSESVMTLSMLLHVVTCLWYSLNKPTEEAKSWHEMGYPKHFSTMQLDYSSYLACLYYCSGRIFNVIFGDSFPLRGTTKILTTCAMMGGFVVVRYWFVGSLAWEYVLENRRWSKFVEQYRYMVKYLKYCGAPPHLLQQAKEYKRKLWYMKCGVLTSDYLKELPHCLKTDLIFDINVPYFHRSLLFRDTGESFLRSISLLMTHELYLKGQSIWNQGVVKCGMFCIKKGVIEMLSDEDDESPMIAFSKGTVLGELSLFYSIPAKVTVKAATYVELQVLKRTDFMRAMSENPQMLAKIRNRIDERLNKAKDRQEDIEAYDKCDSRLIRTRYRPMKLFKDRLAGVEDEDPTFVDDSYLYYRDKNNHRHPKFTTEYLELYELCNNVTTVDEPHICLNSNFPWILRPSTSFTKMFSVFHFLLILYMCIAFPLQAIDMHVTDIQKIFNSIILVALLLNIYIQLTTAIINKTHNITTICGITEYKLSTFGFYLDILSVFPISIITSSLDPNGETMAMEVATLTPIIQVWHIWDYMRHLQGTFGRKVKTICFFKHFILFTIFCYWSGCFLYMYSCPKKLCFLGSWMEQLIYYETKVLVTSNAKHVRPMLSSFAFGTSVFTGSGSSVYMPAKCDVIVIMILFTIGIYLNCIYMARICSIYFLTTERQLKFRQTMRELFYFLTVNRVSTKIKTRVQKYFIVQWYYNNAVSTSEIFKDISPSIQREVLSIERIETLLHCPIFQGCSEDFLQTVSGFASLTILPDNEVVQHAADINRDMYVIHKGFCKLVNYKGRTEKVIGAGNHFGVMEMMFGLPKVFTVVTTTNCVLRRIEYSALVQSWSSFPAVRGPIRNVKNDEELLSLAKAFEEAKPVVGRAGKNMNRIAQELKESFVMLRSPQEREQFASVFDNLGYFRYLRYIFLPGCITPHGIFLKIWCILRILAALYYIIIIPYHVSVRYNLHIGTYNYLDICHYVDLIVMAYVAYYNENKLLITHPLFTVTRYLKTTFAFDLLSVFPFELLFRLVNNQVDYDLCRLNRLLLVTRISGAFAYWESDIMRVSFVVVMFKHLPLVITMVNLMTAVIFMNSCSTYTLPSSKWIFAKCDRNRAMYPNVNGLDFALNEYLGTTFWVFEIFIGCGCTQTGITTPLDTWLVIVLQISGYLYFAFMFGYIAATRSATSKALLDHTENTTDLENFLYQENVDPFLTAKTIKYFEYVWKRTNGSKPQEICRNLNPALMEDTLVFMYERALREVPLFCKVERSFIRVITQHLNEMYFLKGDTVVQCHDLQQNIYIIYRGKVDVLNSYNEMVSCMGPGGMFGNFSGQPLSCSEVAIFASRSLDLLVLPSQTFFHLVKFYPKIQEPLRKAFAVSKDYIMPISMDTLDSSEDESEDENGSSSNASELTRGSSHSHRYSDVENLSHSPSHSNISSTKSGSSVGTYQSYLHTSNLVRPGSFLYQVFGYISCFVTVINYCLILYEVVTLNNCLGFFWILALTDIFFYLKVYLSMHQGYINKRGDFIIEGARCRRRYSKHKFWVYTDIFVNAPLELLGFIFPHPLRNIHYFRAHKMFRLVYIIDFYRKTAAELTNNLTTLQAMTTMVVITLSVHTTSCVWLMVMMAYKPMCEIRAVKIHFIDEEMTQSFWDYITSVYVVVSELTTTGGDEFVIELLLAVGLLTFALICGKMMAAMIVASSMQVAYASKHALTNYETVTRNLMKVLSNQGLSVYQAEKFWNYVKQLWTSERGRQLPVLLSVTPHVRRCDLMSAMFGHHLRNCYLFADTGESFLRQLTSSLEYTALFPGNYIVMAGDSEARMYWVASGTVSVVSIRSDLTETVHELLGAGDVFGILQGLTRGMPHVFSYRAETKVSILTLVLDSWINVLQFFPEARKIIYERSEYLFTQISP